MIFDANNKSPEKATLKKLQAYSLLGNIPEDPKKSTSFTKKQHKLDVKKTSRIAAKAYKNMLNVKKSKKSKMKATV